MTDRILPQLGDQVEDHTPVDLGELVRQAIGAASVCWTEPDRIFDDQRANKLAEELLGSIDQYAHGRVMAYIESQEKSE